MGANMAIRTLSISSPAVFSPEYYLIFAVRACVEHAAGLILKRRQHPRRGSAHGYKADNSIQRTNWRAVLAAATLKRVRPLLLESNCRSLRSKRWPYLP